MAARPKMEIFRAAEVPTSANSAEDSNMLPMSQSTQEGFARLIDAGITDGNLGQDAVRHPRASG